MPTILSSDKCGSKKDGIYLCKRNYYCSKYGYCGKLVSTVILDANQDTVNVGNYQLKLTIKFIINWNLKISIKFIINQNL